MTRKFVCRITVCAAALVAAAVSASAEPSIFLGAGVFTDATDACAADNDQIPQDILGLVGSPVPAAYLHKGEPEQIYLKFGDGGGASMLLVPESGRFSTSFERIRGTTMTVLGVMEWTGWARLRTRLTIADTTEHATFVLDIRDVNGVRGCHAPNSGALDKLVDQDDAAGI